MENNYEIKKGIILTTSMNIYSYLWSVHIIDHNRAGTHEKYNVLFNSVCEGLYFKTEQDAIYHANQELYFPVIDTKNLIAFILRNLN